MGFVGILMPVQTSGKTAASRAEKPLLGGIYDQIDTQRAVYFASLVICLR